MKSYHLKWTSHLPNMGQVFNTLYQSEGMTDVNICCEDGKVKAHKLILSTCSDYFLELFLENIGKQTYVVLPDVKVEELKQILSFIYTGQIEVTDENLPGLLSAADTLGVRGLKNSTSALQQEDGDDDEEEDQEELDEETLQHETENQQQDTKQEQEEQQAQNTQVKSEPVQIKTEMEMPSPGSDKNKLTIDHGSGAQSQDSNGQEQQARDQQTINTSQDEQMDVSQPVSSQPGLQNCRSSPEKGVQLNQQILNMQKSLIPGLLSGSLATQQQANPLAGNMTSPFPGNIATSLPSSISNASTNLGTFSNSLTTSLPGNFGAALTNNLATSLAGNIATSLPGNLGASLPGNLGASLPGNLGASLPGNLGASLPGNLGASLPGNLGASLPGNLGASLPGNLGASLPGNLGAGLPGNLANLEAMYQQVQNHSSPVKILPKLSISDEEASPSKQANVNENGKIQLELDHEAIRKIMENASTPICPMCNKDCANLPNLRSHLQVHNNLKPFACKFCDAKFARVSHLNRHIRVHTGEKPFSCNLCQKSFARQDKLKVHMQRHTKDGTLTLELIVGKKRKKAKSPNSANAADDCLGPNLTADTNMAQAQTNTPGGGLNGQMMPNNGSGGNGYNPNSLWNGFPPTITSMYEQYEPVYPGMMQYNNSTGGVMRIGECSIKPVSQS